MKYSIITPVYNRADCISRCLDSVIRNLSQSYDIEHIIVDDGSKDNSPNIVREYLSKYSHIKFIPFPENRGTNAARNAAIREATGDFCIILDSDDYIVDDAIKNIDDVVGKGEYREYMFAADDWVPYYNTNDILRSGRHVLIKYEDFLSGKVRADFVHVVDRRILLKYPFDERLRIYEYLFFYQFYKEAKEILFTNTVITIRERSRQDSAIRETIRVNKSVIRRCYLAAKTDIDLFSEEYIKYGLTQKLQNLYQKKIENGILLSEYSNIKNDLNSPYFVGKKSPILKCIYFLRLGFFYRIFLYSFLFTKYSLLKAKTR